MWILFPIRDVTMSITFMIFSFSCMYSFLLSVFPVFDDREKQWLSSLKTKFYYSHPGDECTSACKVEKGHSSMDITCKVYYNVVFATNYGFWLSYCFVLAAAPSWHVWWDLLVYFCLTPVKHNHFLTSSSLIALWVLWITLN